jgi:hypothetical protein
MVNKRLNADLEGSFNQKFRSKRFKFFISLLERVKSDKKLRILDIGGEQTYWERRNFLDNTDLEITLLNIKKVDTKNDNFKSVIGDATDLSAYKDKEFDIVYSNSVIEHLFTKENQEKMADEVRRVGKNYYIQTPNYYFPLEPHWYFPFHQFLPLKFRIFLTMHFNISYYKKEPDKEKATIRVTEIQLLTEKNMKQLFPDGKVYRERFLGLKKSITMYKFPEA